MQFAWNASRIDAYLRNKMFRSIEDLECVSLSSSLVGVSCPAEGLRGRKDRTSRISPLPANLYPKSQSTE